MIVAYIKKYRPIEVHGRPDWLFVFGDNLARVGRGGQAVIRGAANAVGVPTKRAPSMDAEAFFSDADYDLNVATIRRSIERIRTLLQSGRYTKLVLPTDGLGTGRAQLARRAPRTARALAEMLCELVESVQPGASARLNAGV